MGSPVIGHGTAGLSVAERMCRSDLDGYTCQVAHVESISKVCGISKTTEEDTHQTWTIL